MLPAREFQEWHIIQATGREITVAVELARHSLDTLIFD